jgi:uncharacterized protein (TIGR00299 family) protein
MDLNFSFMKTYIDCGSGVAGDMLLSALVGLGLSVRELNQTLRRAIPVYGWKVVVKPTERQGWPAQSLLVEGDRFFGSGEKMKHVVRKSLLPRAVKSNAIQILDRLIAAEKKAHGANANGEFDPDGLGLLDTLVDVLGSSWGFWRLGLEGACASAINTGRIAPATAQMLKNYKIPAYSTQSQYELATPTGVAILSVLAETFGAMPSLTIEAAGYGAGQKDIPGKPNVLAIYCGAAFAASGPRPAGMTTQAVLLLETNIDDMDPRLYPHVTDLLFKAGALDVWWVSAGMKKGRPGTAYSVLCNPEDEKRLLGILFNETTTLGVRRLPVERWTAGRHMAGMRKVAHLPGGGTKSQVEYELARQKALALSLPLRKLLK